MALKLNLFSVTSHCKKRWRERTGQTVNVYLALVQSAVILRTADDRWMLLRHTAETTVFLCQRDELSEQWNVVTAIIVPNDEPIAGDNAPPAINQTLGEVMQEPTEDAIPWATPVPDANEKPYLLFAGDYDTEGGAWQTFRGAYATEEEALNATPVATNYGNWWEIVDVRDLKVVDEGPQRIVTIPAPAPRVYRADWLQDSPDWLTAKTIEPQPDIPQPDAWWE